MTLTESYWPADRTLPVLETTVGGVLRDAAAEAPDRTALVAGAPAVADRRRWTYAQLLAEAERAAQALLGRFEPGEHVAVWAHNIPEWVILEFAAGLAGLTLVTVNPAYRPSELAYVLEQSGAAGIVLEPAFRTPMLESLEEVRPKLPALREVILFTEWHAFVAGAAASGPLPDVGPDDIAQIQYTSGTTGFPKGARLHHRGITNNARLYGARAGIGPDDVYVNPMPLFHTAGCGLGVLGATQARAANVLVEVFDPALVLELLESERSTALCGVPTMLLAMIEHPDFDHRDLSSIRVAISGGSPVPAELVRRVEERLGSPFSIVFGTTECSPLITQVRPEDDPEDRATTLGTPLPQTEVRIVHPVEGHVVPPGVVGELCARGYLVMDGYHEAAEASAQAIDAEGWYHTGDLASMDQRGFLRIEGRVKDMIIRGGENIYPREIEDVLFGHPSVAEVAVVGIPDDRWGEVVAAFVRPATGATVDEAELRAWCRDRLAAYKTPQHWVEVAEFPLTASGKIQKFKLRDTFAAAGRSPS